MMDVIIVDDEPAGRRTLREFCEAEGDLRVVGEYGDGVTALAAIRDRRPHLLFLDIQMNPMNGIELARSLEPSRLPTLVFVTAYDAFAVKAFELSALDYLLKPYDRDRFERALARARRAVATPAAPADLAALLAGIRKEERYLRRLLIPNEGRSFFVAAADIVRLEADGNTVGVHAAGGKRYALRATLESLEARLDPEQFARVHRSHVVNIDAIAEIAPWFHGDYQLTLRDGTQLAWSRRYAAKRPDLLP